MNAYELLLEVRDNLNEPTDGTTAHWRDRELLRKINIAHRMVGTLVRNNNEDILLKKSSSLTPVAGVITPPSDCAKPAYLEEVTSGRNIPIGGTIRERRLTRLPGSSLENVDVDAYLMGGTIEVNQASYTTACYLWYVPKIRDLHTGTASAGAATSLTFEASLGHSVQDDYYNGQGIEVVSGTGIGEDTITDYTGSTGACVVTGTYGANSVYGTVSPLPEEAMPLVVLEATLLAMLKPATDVDTDHFATVRSMRNDARNEVIAWCESFLAASSHIRTTELY